MNTLDKLKMMTLLAFCSVASFRIGKGWIFPGIIFAGILAYDVYLAVKNKKL
jgi:hypothetical protein